MKLSFNQISWSDVPPPSLRAVKRRKLTACARLGRRLTSSLHSGHLPVPSPSSSGTHSPMVARCSSVQSSQRSSSGFTGRRSLMLEHAKSEPPTPSPILSASNEANTTSGLLRKATARLSSVRRSRTSMGIQFSRRSSQMSRAISSEDLSAPLPSHFLLYLNRHTYGASAKALAKEICRA